MSAAQNAAIRMMVVIAAVPPSLGIAIRSTLWIAL
jgi:hypothetical protein